MEVKKSVVGEEFKERIISKVKEYGSNITVDFDSAHYNEAKQRVVVVTCNIDGSKHLRKLESLTGNVFWCSECDYNKYADKAKSLNVELLNKSRNHNCVILEVKCRVYNGVSNKFGAAFLTTANYKCSNCTIIKYTELLKLKNCIYISHKIIPNGSSRVTYRNVQGIVRDVSSCALCTNTWIPSLEDSSWDAVRRTYVYKFTFVINNNFSGLENGEYFKIGSSLYPERRLEQLDLTLPICLEILACSTNSKDVRIMEQQIREYYLEYKLDKSIPHLFTKGVSKRRLKDGTVLYKPDGATEWLFIPR